VSEDSPPLGRPMGEGMEGVVWEERRDFKNNLFYYFS